MIALVNRKPVVGGVGFRTGGLHREVEAVPSTRELPFMTIVKDAGAALKLPAVVTPTFAGASLAPLRFRSAAR